MTLAARTADLGKSVVLIENKAFGGTAVNAGAIPKKIMWNLSTFLEEAKLMKHYGVENTEKLTLDYTEFRKALLKHIEGVQEEFRRTIEKPNLEFFTEQAQFTANSVVKVGDRTFTSEHIVIACGSDVP